MQDELERLRKQGYKEVGDFSIGEVGGAHIELTEKSVTGNPNRVDKEVVVTDPNGKTKRVSSIMMGYNKQGIVLADGEFLSSDELLIAMNEAVNTLEEGTIVVSRKGKYLNPEELLKLVALAGGKLVISGPSVKVVNQDSRKWSVMGPDGKLIPKGVAFLGNEGLVLPTGEYVSIEELKKALQDYLVMKKEEVIIVPPGGGKGPGGGKSPGGGKTPGGEGEPGKPKVKEEHKMVRVVRKYKNKATLWLCALSAILVIGSGFGIEDVHAIKTVPDEVTITVVETVKGYDLHYKIGGIEGVLESGTEACDRIIAELGMGELVDVKDGQTFNTNSGLTGVDKTMGGEFSREGKYEGNYEITGYSIVANGQVVAFIENFNGNPMSINLGDFIEQTLKDNNLSRSDINVRLHLGKNGDSTRLGWIDVTDLINENTITDDMLKTKMQEYVAGSGSVEYTAGMREITLDNGVTINVFDANGNLLPEGTMVLGSDGETYRLTSLELVETEKQVPVEKTIITDKEVEVVVGKKLVWKVENCSLLVGVLPLVAAALIEADTRKKNKEAEANPTFFEFENEREYQKFKRDFETAKAKYERSSSFKRMLKETFFRKETDLLKNLTEEQIQELYTAIKRHAGIDFVYTSEDRIEVKDGKIYIHYADGHFMNITDIVREDIKFIGKDNEVVTEGRLDEGNNIRK